MSIKVKHGLTLLFVFCVTINSFKTRAEVREKVREIIWKHEPYSASEHFHVKKLAADFYPV